MTLPQLYPEIWARIVTFLQRPKPALRTEEWKDLHQQDLASMMRVSKMHFRITAPLLYREPVFENVLSFLESIEIEYNAYEEEMSRLHKEHMAKIEAVTTDDDMDELEDCYWEEMEYLYDERFDEELPFWPLYPPELNICEEGSPRPPTRSAKAFCYQYTESIHIILTEKTHSVIYSTMFLISDEKSRARLWRNATTEISTPYIHPMNQESDEWASDLAIIYEKEIFELFRQALGTDAYSFLRPQRLTFGAYGSLSWNQRQTNIHIHEEKDRVFGRAQNRRSSKHEFGWDKGAASAGLFLRFMWSTCNPQKHCNRFHGGPLGVIGQPILGRQATCEKVSEGPKYKPRMTILHLEQQMPLQGITWGAANIVVHHPFDSSMMRINYPYEMLVRDLIASLKNLEFEVHRQRSRGTLIEGDGSTSIEIYWYIPTEDYDTKREIRVL